MPDYSKGKIYVIRNTECDEVYIGSTTQSLNDRLTSHREKYISWKKGKFRYITSFKLFEVGEPMIELVEDYPCESKKELERREGEFIKLTENCVNQRIAGRTKKEYLEDNREHIKEYYEANKEHISECDKKRYELNKEHYKELNKKWREANKEYKREYDKEYREVNKDKNKEYQKEYCKVNKERKREYDKERRAKLKASLTV